MSDERLLETMIVAKLDPPSVERPPTRKLVVQYAPARPSSSALLWFLGAVILAIGFLQPLERIDQRQLRLSSSAQALLRLLGNS
jgi:hypothetical protein